MKETPRQELVDFLRYCESERRLAPATCAAYERDVSACLGYLQAGGIELVDARVTHLRAFLAVERERRPAVASQARTTAALKSFFRFLVEEERLVPDPSLPLRTPKKPEAPGHVSSDVTQGGARRVSTPVARRRRAGIAR